MDMTTPHLLTLISQGETEHIEFKARIINQHDIARVLTAFANNDGGYLIIGVGDRGEIIGLPDEELTMHINRLSQVCKSLFSYPYDIGHVDIGGKALVYVKINKAPDYLSPITTSTGNIYIRKGDRNVEVKDETRSFSLSMPRSGIVKELRGFVAMSFRDEEEPALIDYYNGMLRAVQKTGLKIKLDRMDLKDGDYELSQQLMTEIDNCDFVLADYTLNPHNVYFEVGYARGAKKRILQTARKGVVLQFDVRNWPILYYRNATELEEKLIPKFIAIYSELTK